MGADPRRHPPGNEKDVFRASAACGFICWRWRRCCCSGPRDRRDARSARSAGDGLARIRFRARRCDSIAACGMTARPEVIEKARRAVLADVRGGARARGAGPQTRQHQLHRRRRTITCSPSSMANCAASTAANRCNLQQDSLIFATVFQFFYLRLAIFFGCVGHLHESVPRRDDRQEPALLSARAHPAGSVCWRENIWPG